MSNSRKHAEKSAFRKTRVLLVPDRYAHYRKGIFEAINNAYDVTILAAFEKDISGINVASDGGQFVRGQNWFDLKDVFFSYACVWQRGLLRYLNRLDYDVAVFWGDIWRLSTWTGVMLARMRGKKVVFWTHGLYGNERLLKKWLRLTLYKLGSHTFTYGDFARNLLVSAGFDASKVTVVANSLPNSSMLIDLTKSESKTLAETVSDSVKLCFIGRLESGKKLELLVRALAHLQGKGRHNVELHIVGAGSDKTTIIEQARALNVEQYLHLHGALYTDAEVHAALNDCSICISPGNVGLTAITALSLGIPVVTHNNPVNQMPEYESVREGVTGRLFSEGNLDDLVNCIELVLDDIKCERITRYSCQSVVERCFSVDSQLQAIHGVLKEM